MSTSEIPQREMINRFIESLRKEQFLDQNFSFKENKQENLKSWSTFCADFEANLDQVSKSLRNQQIDFKDVEATMKKMKANATRIGGKRVAEACAALQQFSGDSNIDGCNEAYNNITGEYHILRDCFHMILQAERTTLFTEKLKTVSII